MKTWIQRLRSNYSTIGEFADYCDKYGLLERMGYKLVSDAWRDNPHVGGSTNPDDFGVVKLDDFTIGYITCALWSSTGGRYGECPCCGKMAVLDRYPEKEYEEQAMCAAEGCGVREMNEEPPLDENYDIDDIAPNTLAQMVNDCAKFQEENSELLAKAEYVRKPDGGTDLAYAGHDFWLSTNGHGAGYGDGDMQDNDVDDALNEACKKWKGMELYVGDDGKIYS